MCTLKSLLQYGIYAYIYIYVYIIIRLKRIAVCKIDSREHMTVQTEYYAKSLTSGPEQ